MLTKPLGRTGLEIAEVGLGTWQYQGGAAPLRRGFEAGALFVDTAESYGSEETVRDALAGMRDAVFIATKVSSENLRRENLLRSAEGSLRRLGVSHIDLYQVHFPNPEIPIEETMETMEQLVDEGKIRYIGVSNFSLEQLIAARRATRKHPIVSIQVSYNLANRDIENRLLGYCQTHGITVIAHSPLANDLSRITHRDSKGMLTRLSQETGRTIAQIAINWCLCQEDVVAIPKGNSVAHVIENCAASGWRLSAEQTSLLDKEFAFQRRGRFGRLIRELVPDSVVPLAKRCVGMLSR